MIDGIGGVLTGIDVLLQGNCAPLRGRRVGLVTTHTGRTRAGQATADALHNAPSVTLAALFGPEHGVRGTYDQPQIADSVDDATGVPVYSLYGKRTAPTDEQLHNIDILVYDIQDIGTRFYTYISTLLHVMTAASAHNIPVLVLDRPNPITGTRVEGPVADADALSFTACHPLPVRHGLTIGEAARLMHHETGLSGGLTVVPCKGWKRGDWYDAGGLLWTNPSPNMRSLTQATLYPGIGLLEMTNLSVGRGTDMPFEIVGAPWLDARAFAWHLNAQNVPGARFVPREVTPRASVHAGALCGGVNVLVTDRDALDAVRLGLTIALALRDLHSSEWDTSKLGTLLAHDTTRQGIINGQDYAHLASGWAEAGDRFRVRRQRWLLYD